jgi:hypothetical protein
VQTLHYTTLTKEYEQLFGKLSRQRVKCETFERKFQVSDAEIISLSTDKDRLEDQIAALERQIRSLEGQRDDARKAGEESKGQWMRIVEMAGKLHGGAAAAGLAAGASGTSGGADALAEAEWADERARLQRRIAQLEANLAIKNDGEDVLMEGSTSPGLLQDPVARARIAWLEDELDKLRTRNGKLEKGVLAAKQAALTLAAHGQNVGTVLSRALGES